MATTSSTENMFPSSSSATSSISSGTAGAGGMGSSGMGGSGAGTGGSSGSGLGTGGSSGSGLGGSSLSGGVDSALGTSAGSTTATRPQSDVLTRVVQGAHNAIDKLADTVAPHVQRLEQGVGTASESLHLRADHAREVGDEWAESLRSTVRENPLAAVATALAVGLLVARLTR
ncbi:MAG TPA: hypothetical protein VK439_11340 [Rubrivivax sp.]|nr:hypothetical protein [Rubrivivax sp.]HLL19367.1 hypothetical protein [Rubrivivax sp.]